MPYRPEDDWTRPMPRGGGRDDERFDPQTAAGESSTSDAFTDQETTQQISSQSPARQVVSRGREPGHFEGYSDQRDADQGYPDRNHWSQDYPRQDHWSQGSDYPGDDYPGSGYQDYPRQGDPGRRPPGPRPPRRKRPRYRLRRVLVLLVLLVLAYVGSMIWAVSGVWNSVSRVDATPTSTDRPAAGSGSNFVLVGTDSRADLSHDQRNDLVTGQAEGARADTIMVLHLPDAGDPTLLSVPRDSYVQIPGKGWNKINAAYAMGGPPLLVDTVEQSTGLRVEGYLEIGFGGFVDVVKTVDGVRMCLKEPVVDKKTKLDLPAGCQNLEGAEALNYVRMRYGDPRGDLGRVERQREFLAALTHKMATPANVLLPWRLHDMGTTTGSALAIGEDTSMMETGRMAWAMRSISNGDGQSITVPVANANYQTKAGSSVLWDEQKAAKLFDALNTDTPLTIEP